MDAIKLVVPEKPKPNAKLIEEVEKILEDAKSGKIKGFIAIKFQTDGTFAIRKVGHLSDLEVCGSLDFAKYDIISTNTPH